MYKTNNLQEKWDAVLNHKDVPAVTDRHKKAVLTVLLENQAREGGSQELNEAVPANAADGFPSNNSNLKGYDSILISMIRRTMPNLMAFDVCGVQPMQAPSGMIFAIKSKYTSQGGTEALHNEADSFFSGTSVIAGEGPQSANPFTSGNFGSALSTADGEKLGTGSNLSDGGTASIAEMAFSIDKVIVEAKTRALKAEYTLEIAQDLKAVHGLDAETELSNMLSTEILSEINREVVRTIYNNAVAGAQNDVTTAGTFDCNVDSNGRWSVERFKGLMFQIERDANAIAKQTRRGRGNFVICDSDTASALSMAGLLDCGSALKDNLNVDDTGNTFAGVLNNRFKVYVDPYVPLGTNYYVVGFKGANAYDAGLFYCPYVPLQVMKAVDPNSFQPKIGFKTRYGLVTNPFGNLAGNSTGALTANANIYYRKVTVTNLM